MRIILRATSQIGYSYNIDLFPFLKLKLSILGGKIFFFHPPRKSNSHFSFLKRPNVA